jgi:aminopeptidase N
MSMDALVSSHPLSTPAEEINTPSQISELFDTISYSKVLPSLPAGPERGVGHGRELGTHLRGASPQLGLWGHLATHSDTGSW